MSAEAFMPTNLNIFVCQLRSPCGVSNWNFLMDKGFWAMPCRQDSLVCCGNLELLKIPPGNFFCGVHSGSLQGVLLSRFGDGPVFFSLVTKREEIHLAVSRDCNCGWNDSVPLGPVLVPWVLSVAGSGFCSFGQCTRDVDSQALHRVRLLPHHLQTLKHFQVSTGKVNPVPTKCPNVFTLMGVGLSHLPISYVVFLSPLDKISVCLSGSFVSFTAPTWTSLFFGKQDKATSKSGSLFTKLSMITEHATSSGCPKSCLPQPVSYVWCLDLEKSVLILWCALPSWRGSSCFHLVVLYLMEKLHGRGGMFPWRFSSCSTHVDSASFLSWAGACRRWSSFSPFSLMCGSGWCVGSHFWVQEVTVHSNVWCTFLTPSSKSVKRWKLLLVCSEPGLVRLFSLPAVIILMLSPNISQAQILFLPPPSLQPLLCISSSFYLQTSLLVCFQCICSKCSLFGCCYGCKMIFGYPSVSWTGVCGNPVEWAACKAQLGLAYSNAQKANNLWW